MIESYNLEDQYPTKHFTREIISQFFEKEKVLRALSGKERDNYRKEFFRVSLPEVETALKEYGLID